MPGVTVRSCTFALTMLSAKYAVAYQQPWKQSRILIKKASVLCISFYIVTNHVAYVLPLSFKVSFCRLSSSLLIESVN